MQNLFLLCHFKLQEIRFHFKKPVVPTSGYRSKEKNDAVGGSPTSQHLYGEAVDFVIPDQDMREVFNFVVKSGWGGQCFLYPKKGHVHLALPKIGLLPTKGIRE
jgi:uncharacterized protein YcbK (DUF882 family)